MELVAPFINSNLTLAFVGVLAFIYFAYFNLYVRRLFHQRRVRIYYSQTHPKRHEKEKQNSKATVAQKINSKEIVVPRIGQVVSYDFRPRNSQQRNIVDIQHLRVVSWNIEFGYKLEQVVQELQRLGADVILLQEVDTLRVGTRFSIDVFHTIVSSLQMNGVYAGHHRYQVGADGVGVWGNAVLSRFDIDTQATHFIPFDDVIKGYPRSALRTKVFVPKLGDVLCYSAHFEVCCGIKDRVAQFGRVYDDYKRAAHQFDTKKALIGGDFNTIGHGWARVSPAHCTDNLRFGSLGHTESEWWDLFMFSNPQQIGYGFLDPFHKRKDITYVNKFVRAKLDWLLVSDGLLLSTSIKHKEVGTGKQSDHHWIMVELNVIKSS